MILLIGGEGSIGKRYQAILEYLEEPYIVYDFPFISGEKWPHFDRAIIASPTHTHLDYCEKLEEIGKPYLCEKPLSKNVERAKALAEKSKCGFVVNNYTFLKSDRHFKGAPKNIEYDFFNTGRDGLIWDVCQLVYLAFISRANLSVSRRSYAWTLHLDNWDVPYNAIEASYLQMIRSFLLDRFDSLWAMHDGAAMTEVCNNLFERGGDCEGFDWDAATNATRFFSKDDLRRFRH